MGITGKYHKRGAEQHYCCLITSLRFSFQHPKRGSFSGNSESFMPGINSVLKFLLAPLLVLLFTACGGTGEDLLSQGEELFANYICNTCHSLDGSDMYGPSLQGLYGQEIRVVRNGEEKTLLANRRYLKRAIIHPDHEKVAGFEDRIMPRPQMSKSDVKLLVDYLIALDDESR